jgi:hypothetical protein
MDMSTEYEVILLTSEEPKGRCKSNGLRRDAQAVP